MNPIQKKKLQLVREFYNSLDRYKARKVTALVTSNKKLEETSTGTFKAAGISLYPAFKSSCSDAGTCKDLCIAFTGIGQISAGSTTVTLTNIDKAQLKRLWLFKNESNYFYSRAKNELEKLSDFGAQQILFREITSECIDYAFFEDLDFVRTYGYFKNAAKITNNIGPKYKIYSWSEKSTRQNLLDCSLENLPIAVVIPKKLFNKIFTQKQDYICSQNVRYHNGDKSDMSSTFNLEKDKLNIHFLSEKTARFSNKSLRPVFLDSYRSLFTNMFILYGNKNQAIINQVIDWSK